MDACVVLMEGGDENDISMLTELDYVIEEKKEQSYDVQLRKDDLVDGDDDEAAKEEVGGNGGCGPMKLLQEVAFNPDAAEDDAAFGKAMKGGRTKDEQTRDETSGMVNSAELEQMQHARDYSLYIEQHKLEGRDVSDLPDNTDPATMTRETSYVGSGVFVSQVGCASIETSICCRCPIRSCSRR